MSDIAKWLGGNWGWALAIFCVFFEIAPIKLHPISALLGWLGKKLTGNIQKELTDLKNDVTDLRGDVTDLRADVDNQRMANIRTLVLDFSNSCLNGRQHTKEEFDHVIEENRTYENLVRRYNVENDVYTEAYAYIKRVYRKRLDKRDFLSAMQQDPT